MVIKVYLSTCSGNMEIKKKQEFILNVLQGRKIAYEEVDISDPTVDEAKQYMREKASPKQGQNVPLPPQVFNGDDYCGDFDDFHEANEVEGLYDFLKLASPKSISPTENGDQVQNGDQLNGDQED